MEALKRFSELPIKTEAEWLELQAAINPGFEVGKIN
jgi:hypothetical protein